MKSVNSNAFLKGMSEVRGDDVVSEVKMMYAQEHEIGTGTDSATRNLSGPGLGSGLGPGPGPITRTGSGPTTSFSDFLHEETSKFVFSIINLINSIFGLVMFVTFLIDGVDFLFLGPAILRFLLLIPLNLYQYRLMNSSTLSSDRFLPNMWLGDVIILLFSVANGLNILVFAYPGNCESGMCPDYDDELPTGPMLGYFMQVLCMIFVIKCHHTWAGWLAIFFQALLTFTLATRMNSEVNFFVGLLLALIFEVLVVFDFKRYLHRTHANIIQIENTIRAQVQAEQDRKMEESRSSELRYLFGNVAHDLKTPLQSFLLELDTLQHMANDANTSKDISSDKCANLSNQVNESVNMLQNVCSFMLMTINRAIDHTKSTSGISLVPKYESVNLMDSFRWVSQCIGKSEMVHVVISPMPEEIGPVLVTDNQWLLENLLCLVSNAHKFTISGFVRISCRLISPTSLENVDSAEMLLDLSSMPKANLSSGVAKDMTTPNAMGDIEMGFSQCHTDMDVGMSCSECGVLSPFSDPVPHALSSNKMLLIEVEDTGTGVPVEKRSSLFQPHQQAQQGAGGTGLGLFSMCNRVAALGGVCGVSDRNDGEPGARFWFTLPYCTVTTSDRHAEKDKSDESKSFESFHEMSKSLLGVTLATSPETLDIGVGKAVVQDIINRLPSRVLLVEDSLMIRKATVRAFQRKNVQIDIAVNGVECLLQMEKCAYSLILMDIEMPAMGGLETVDCIRKLKYDTDTESNVTGKDVIVVGVSANSDSLSEREALAAGMDSFFPKPLSLQKLQDCLEQLNCPLVPSEV